MPLAGYRPAPSDLPSRTLRNLPPRVPLAAPLLRSHPLFGFHDPKRESNTLRGETRGASYGKRARVPTIALWRQAPFFLLSFSVFFSPSCPSFFYVFFELTERTYGRERETERRESERADVESMTDLKFMKRIERSHPARSGQRSGS